MALSIMIGRTNKQINSTSQQLVDSVNLSCRLKEPTSMQAPVFIVQGLTKMTLYNYAKFENRYYWVDDVVYLTTDTQEIHCHLDPLATFKGAIENTFAYVTFGPAGSKNTKVDDIRFGPDWKLDEQYQVHQDLDIGLDLSNWSIVITAQYSIDLISSGVATYAMDASFLGRFLEGFANEITNQFGALTQIVDIIQTFCTMVLNGGASAMENIKSCILLPMSVTTYADPVTDRISTMKLGSYYWNLPSDVVIYSISPTKSVSKSGNFGLGRTSVIPNYKYHWLNSPKYCSIEVSHPNGISEINDMALLDRNTIYWYSEVIPATGDYVIRFTSESGKDNDTIAMLSGNVGVDIFGLIPNGKMFGMTMLNAVTTTGMNVASGFGSYYKKTEATENKNRSTPVVDSEGNPTGKRSIDKGVTTKNTTEYGSSGISGSFNPGSNGPTIKGTAFNSGLAGLLSLPNGQITVDVEYYYPGIINPAGVMETSYEAYCDLYGYPVNRYLQLGNLKGYIECAGASVQAALGANTDNKSTINSYLNNGFYLED